MLATLNIQVLSPYLNHLLDLRGSPSKGELESLLDLDQIEEYLGSITHSKPNRDPRSHALFLKR